MLAFMVRRILLAVFTVWVISVVAFALIHPSIHPSIHLPPGDWFQSYVADLRARDVHMDEKTARQLVFQLQHRYGLDQPLAVQYLRWAGEVLQGHFGKSLEHSRPVSAVLGDRMMMTVVLAVATVMFTWTMAIPVGIYSAVRQYPIEDYTFTFLGFIGLATPDFMLALIFMYMAFAYLGWSPGGLFSPEYMTAPWAGCWSFSSTCGSL